MKKYHIITFGCQQNVADSERIAKTYENKGYIKAENPHEANVVILNTCMVREKAENRVYGFVNNLKDIKLIKQQNFEEYKIIVTGCMIGAAYRDKTGKFLKKIRNAMPSVDEFLPIEEIGFDLEPIRGSEQLALVPISNGCNNFCTFCIVPFTRGREISRPYDDIIEECRELKVKGYSEIMLLGQNVNSYGADLILGFENIQVMRDLDTVYFESENKKEYEYTLHGKVIKPVYVKHLNRMRIPTLFPYLLDEVAKMGFLKVSFMSSNPWDFTDELIAVIAKNTNITREIHLPVQHGDNNVLKRMNRWYTREEYIALIKKMRSKIANVTFSTDIIVGFCDETEEEYQSTIDLVNEIGFEKGYISIYSSRPLTAATKVMDDNVPHHIKKDRWKKLDNIINNKYNNEH